MQEYETVEPQNERSSGKRVAVEHPYHAPQRDSATERKGWSLEQILTIAIASIAMGCSIWQTALSHQSRNDFIKNSAITERLKICQDVLKRSNEVGVRAHTFAWVAENVRSQPHLQIVALGEPRNELSAAVIDLDVAFDIAKLYFDKNELKKFSAVEIETSKIFAATLKEAAVDTAAVNRTHLDTAREKLVDFCSTPTSIQKTRFD